MHTQARPCPCPLELPHLPVNLLLPPATSFLLLSPLGVADCCIPPLFRVVWIVSLHAFTSMRRSQTFGTDSHTHAGRQVRHQHIPHTLPRLSQNGILGLLTVSGSITWVLLLCSQHLIEMMMRHQQRLRDIADGKREVAKGRQLYNGMNTSQPNTTLIQKPTHHHNRSTNLPTLTQPTLSPPLCPHYPQQLPNPTSPNHRQQYATHIHPNQSTRIQR